MGFIDGECFGLLGFLGSGIRRLAVRTLLGSVVGCEDCPSRLINTTKIHKFINVHKSSELYSGGIVINSMVLIVLI